MDAAQALLDRIAALEARVSALESQTPVIPPIINQDLGLVRLLQQRTGSDYEHELGHGAFLFAGSINSALGNYVWQGEYGLGELLRYPAEQLISVLSALASPVRLQIIQTLLESPASSQSLLERLNMQSAGQLYHHLKELRNAGIITQRGRSDYTLEITALIPVMVILAAAKNIGD
ncbi:MAG TPA: ArsR family transcriptional regulator [Herpetosiphon sp.]|uniref:Transcriptional regulator, ArsR family n=1 Tax=Herpetosiphon aurantiacus (strain ATCC 23779 / DSM 785 / 114-95) TaxID=316274 RepID=A9B8C1_HERA2|nr:winged helix-turn-helix domain-containing protein [Herpetosiphon sp.]ABX06474.1 transcriptional regulator, ArsR family [Herpetosiphon aurantiacus DSM 785]HBW50142.1 ArsR family transcriptional regulator [Herpetosiphon sp.]